MFIDVSEERIASTFRQQAELCFFHVYVLQVACLAFSTLKMEAECYSETSIKFLWDDMASRP
jgi:hypothetical protein